MTHTMQKLRVFLGGTGLAVGAFGVGQLVILVAAFFLQLGGVPVATDTTLQVALGIVLLQGVTFGGIAVGYLRYSDRSLAFLNVRMPTIRDGLFAIGGVVGLLAFLIAASQLLAAMGISTATNTITEIGKQSPEIFLLLVPLSYLLIGPGEELLYRGLIQGVFEESFGPMGAIGLASGLFAVVHVFSLSDSGKFAYIGIVFGLALILGTIYELTDNLVVPAFIHGTYNAVQFAVIYLETTGAVG